MRKLLGLVLVVGLLTGCPDEKAQQRMDAEARFAEALAQFEKANRNYGDGTRSAADVLVAHKNASEGKQRYDGTKFNLDELEKAAGLLDAVVKDADASSAEKMGAAQMLAQVHAAHARQLAREAKVAWADIENMGMEMTAALASLQLNDAVVRLNAPDLQPIISQLEKNRQQAETQQADLSREVSALETEVAKLEGDVEKLSRERDDFIRQSQELERAAAANEDRDAGHQQELKAVELAHEAEKRVNRIQDIEDVKLNMFKAELVIAKDRLNHVEKGIAALDEQIKAAIFQQSQSNDLASKNAGNRSKSASDVEAKYDALAKRFTEEVDDKLTEADERSEKAIKALDTAINNARNSGAATREQLMSQRMTTRVAQARILTQHLNYTGSIGTLTAMLATNAPNLMPEKADFFKTAYDRHVQNQAAIQKKATEVFKSTGEAIDEVKESGSEEIASLAKVQDSTLASFEARMSGDGALLPADPGNKDLLEPIAIPDVVRPDATDSTGSTDPGSGTGDVPNVQATGEMPTSLPEIAYNSQYGVFVVIDGRHLTPKRIDAAIDNLLGEMAAQMKGSPEFAQSMGMFYDGYAKLVEAGVVGVVIAASPPDPNAGLDPDFDSSAASELVMIALKDGADPEKVKAAFGELMPGEEAEFTSSGNWLIANQPGKQLPRAGDAARQSVVDPAMASVTGNAISFVVVNDEKARAVAGGATEGLPPEMAALGSFSEKAEWMAGSVSLEKLTIQTISKMPTANDAAEVKTAMDQAIAQAAQQLGGQDSPLGPMGFMVAGAIGQAVKCAANNDQVVLTLDLNPLKPVIGPLIAMGMQGGPGGPGGPGDDFPGPGDEFPGPGDPDGFPELGGPDDFDPTK